MAGQDGAGGLTAINKWNRQPLECGIKSSTFIMPDDFQKKLLRPTQKPAEFFEVGSTRATALHPFISIQTASDKGRQPNPESNQDARAKQKNHP